MTGCRIIVAMIVLVASTLGGAAQTPHEPDLKPGEFIPAAAPQPAPEMSFDGLDGKPVALADFKGKLLIFNLWATWCHPCVKEMPSLAKLQARLGRGLAVLAVSEDRGGADVVKPFVAKLDVDAMTIGLDPKGEAMHALHPRGLPISLVIGADGTVLGTIEGAADWDSDELTERLTKLLPVSPGR
jgi:thiol-disulfide isomerase/thioredoxin